jgi:regulatory protein
VRGRAELSLKARALQLLAQREHSVLELRRKLLDHLRRQQVAATPDAIAGRRLRDPGPQAEAEVEAMLAWLREGGHLSDARFAESRLRARAPRYGNLRLRDELARHGLRPSPDEAAALAASEFERAHALWSRRFDAPPGNAAERARQTRFLAGRGFSADVIRRLMRGGGEDD